MLKETGGLILRETAQTPDEDMDAFTDVERHPYFHVNNLWVDLQALDALLRERDGVMGLPMIVNEKTVDPADSSTPAVYQLETAMGAAIGVVRGRAGDPRAALALRAGQEDLRSAGAALGRLRARRGRADRARGRARRRRRSWSSTTITSSCSPTSSARFPEGPPSLAAAERLAVKGDVTFGRDVVVRGAVSVEGPRRVEDGAELEGR